jgi:transposase-like protein
MTASLQDKTDKSKAVKSYPVCPKCKKKMDSRVARGTLVKMVLFWLPIRRYKCSSCNRKRYIVHN